jgi:hypothetical protein
VIILLVPAMVVFLVRLARQYETEADQLEHDVPAAIAAPILRRHIVLVFVDRLDLAAARAIQYARTLMPDDLRAVHFVLDKHAADELATAWTEHGMSQIALDLVDCPDRRLTRAAVETVARDLAAGDVEVSVLLPERKYRGVWHRILHDQTADAISRDVSRLPHANVTTVPFHFTSDRTAPRAPAERTVPDHSTLSPNGSAVETEREVVVPDANGVIPIAAVHWREPVVLEGRVRTIRVKPLAGTSTLECVLDDGTGAISIVFLGRPRIRGIDVGTRLRVRGTAGQHHGRLAILNPAYELLP